MVIDHARRDSNLGPLTPQSDSLTARPLRLAVHQRYPPNRNITRCLHEATVGSTVGAMWAFHRQSCMYNCSSSHENCQMVNSHRMRLPTQFGLHNVSLHTKEYTYVRLYVVVSTVAWCQINSLYKCQCSLLRFHRPCSLSDEQGRCGVAIHSPDNLRLRC